MEFFFFFSPKQLLLAQENLTLHWRSRQCHQYLGVIVNLSPSWVSEWKSLSCVQLSCDTTQLCPHGLYSAWNSPGQKTGVGSFFLLQGIFPTLGSEPRSPALQVDSLPAEPPGKPKNTGVDTYPFSRGSFRTKNLTRVSCIAGGFFTTWTIRNLVKQKSPWTFHCKLDEDIDKQRHSNKPML